MLYNGIDITVDLEVLRFLGAKIRSIVQTSTMYKSELVTMNIIPTYDVTTLHESAGNSPTMVQR